MTGDRRGPAGAEQLCRLQQALQRSRQDHDMMALALLAACQALDQTRHALQLSQARESRARQLGALDMLTGLPNRIAFARRSGRTLAAHARTQRGFALLFVDLDGFKAVNDRLGHAAGDALLAVIGARLAHALREDDFVSRHGGDEFVCLLPDIADDTQALALAGKLAAAVSTPCRIGSETLQVGASVGVALYPRDGSSVAALLERADGAMLWAKAQGAGIGLASRVPAAPDRPQPVPRRLAVRVADGNGSGCPPRGGPGTAARPVPPSGAVPHGPGAP